MKKRFSLLLALLIFPILASCSNSSNSTTSNNVNKYQEIKNIINKLDESTFNNFGINIHLAQKYVTESHIDNNLEKADYKYTYEGNGSFRVAYLSGNQGANGIIDLITSGEGLITSNQNETISLDYKELDKISNETKEEKTNNTKDYQLTMLLKNQECQLSSISDMTNLIDNSTKNDKFNGKISQSLLENDSLKTSISDLMSRMLIMDGYYLSSSVDEYFKKILLDSKKLSDDEFINFVDNNNFEIIPGDEKIFLSFLFDFTDFFKKNFEVDNAKDVKIKGKIGFDLENYGFEYFGYDLKNCFVYLLDKGNLKDVDDNQITTVEEYFVEGEAVRVDLNAVKLDNLVEYNDAQEFLSDFILHALPFEEEKTEEK